MTTDECTCGHTRLEHGDWMGDCYGYETREKLCDCKAFKMKCCFGQQYHSPHCSKRRDSSGQRKGGA